MPAGNIRTHHPKAPHATTPQRATRIAFVALALWTELAGPESARLTTALAERESIRKNGRRLEQVAEPRTLAIRDGRVRLDVGSGQYYFETQWPSPTPHR